MLKVVRLRLIFDPRLEVGERIGPRRGGRCVSPGPTAGPASDEEWGAPRRVSRGVGLRSAADQASSEARHVAHANGQTTIFSAQRGEAPSRLTSKAGDLAATRRSCELRLRSRRRRGPRQRRWTRRFFFFFFHVMLMYHGQFLRAWAWRPGFFDQQGAMPLAGRHDGPDEAMAR